MYRNLRYRDSKVYEICRDGRPGLPQESVGSLVVEKNDTGSLGRHTLGPDPETMGAVVTGYDGPQRGVGSPVVGPGHPGPLHTLGPQGVVVEVGVGHGESGPQADEQRTHLEGYGDPDPRPSEGDV